MGARGPGEPPPVVRKRAARQKRKQRAAASLIPGLGQAQRAQRPKPARPAPRHAAQVIPGLGPTVRRPRPVRIPPKPKAPPPRAARRVAAQVPGLGQAREQQRAQKRGGEPARRRVEQRQRQQQQQRVRQVAAAARTGGDFDASQRNPSVAARIVGTPQGQTHERPLLLSDPESVTDKAARRTARRIGKPITLGADDHYYVKQERALLPDRHLPVDPFTGHVDRKYLASGRAESGKVQLAAIQAPALKVLDQTTRPIHAISAGQVRDIKAHGGGLKGVVGSLADVQSPTSREAAARRGALKRGVQLKDRSLGSDVLKAAGVKNKAVRAVGGFVLDVGQDPTTFVTGGTGAVAARTATRAATRVERKAVAKGIRPERAQVLGQAAARRAEREAPKGRGVTVNVAGRELPGIRRATAAVARGTRQATRKVAGERVSTAVPAVTRSLVREVAPRVAPAGISREAHMIGRAQARTARAKVASAAAKSELLERELKRHLSPEDMPRVVDAIERGKLSRIIAPTQKARERLRKEDPREYERRQGLARLAHDMRSQLRGQHRQSLRAGAQPKPQPREYLTKQDLKRLDRTVASEQAAQRRTVVRAGRQEARAEASATLAAREGQLRRQGRVAVTREQEIAAARRGVASARRNLQTELRKPVTQRRGVPVLEARVRQAEQAWQHARRPVRTRLPAVPPTGVRAGRAAQRYERRGADTLLAQRRLEAAQRIPTRSAHETPEAYLRRVIQHADNHDLPLVRRRAQTLLDKAPRERARGYWPRETEERITDRLLGRVERMTGVAPETPVGGTGRAVSRTTAGHRRQEIRPLRVVNPERVARGDKPYSTDVPLVVANHLRQAARAASQGEFAQNMAQAVGRPVRRAEDLHESEDLYKLGYRGQQFGLHKITSRKLPTGGRGGGQYVAMPRNFFEQMERSTRGTAANNPLVMAFDQVQSGWKRAATLSLAFHIRNLIGDVTAGYAIPGAGGSLRQTRAAVRATRRSSEQIRQLRPPRTDATIKVAGREQNLDEFLKGARDNGVLDSGIIAREIREVGTDAERTRTRARGRNALQRSDQAVDRWMTNRENVMRLAAYKSGLDRGMKPTEAADMANLFHIDYSELSRSERAFFRRAMPFYTWTARSLPVAGLTLIQRPGKFATIEKAREETGQAFSGEDETDLRLRMPASVARQLPVVIRVGGSDYAVSASIPATLLNEVPADTDVTKWMDEISHFGVAMITPLAKAPTELYFNQNAFTKRPVEDPERPLTPAPQWIAKAPDWVKQMTGATPDYTDSRTGKKMWGWRGRADWASRQVPGLPQQVSAAASGSRPGQEQLPPAASALGLAGVRSDKLGRETAQRAQAARKRERLADLNRRAGILNQRGINRQNPTSEYNRLRDQINALSKELYPKRKRGGDGGGPLPLAGGGGGPKLPLGGGSSGGKLPLG